MFCLLQSRVSLREKMEKALSLLEDSLGSRRFHVQTFFFINCQKKLSRKYACDADITSLFIPAEKKEVEVVDNRIRTSRVNNRMLEFGKVNRTCNFLI